MRMGTLLNELPVLLLLSFFVHSLGLNEKSKGNDAFIDLLPGQTRLDKVRQDKLKRFRESIANKSDQYDADESNNDDHRTVFNISWKDNGEYQSDDVEYQRYLRTFNAAIFLRMKSLSERHIDASGSNLLKCPEQNFYNETLVHLTHYKALSLRACLGFEQFIQTNPSVKQWLTSAQTAEHYPLMIMGSRASGKSLLCTKLVQYLLTTLDKTSQCLVRYVNLTNKSRHITELFASICTQMSVWQHAPSMDNEENLNRVEYYRSVLMNLSKHQKSTIIMIDGIEEPMVQSQYATSFMYYSALLQLLPPNVGIVFLVFFILLEDKRFDKRHGR
jgi:hypothetical protein